MTVDRDENGNGRKNWVRLNYRCYTAKKLRSECDTKDFKMNNLDTYIENLMFNVLLNERYTKHIYRLIREKLGVEYDRTKKELIQNQVYIDKVKGEIKNLVSSLAEARTFAYHEIVKEIERLTLEKTDAESKRLLIKKQMEDYPIFNEPMICSSIGHMKSLIKSRTVEYMKPVLKLLVKEISLTNEEIQVKVNLNAYLNSKSGKDLEIIIVENPNNVRDTNKQLMQNLSWTSLTIRV